MSGNQGFTPGRQSAAIPGRLSAIPPSLNPRPLPTVGASGHQRIVNAPLPNPRSVVQGASGHHQQINQAVVLATANPRLTRPQMLDPNRRFTVTDPTILARISALNRSAHLRPSAPIVQSPASTPTPGFRLPTAASTFLTAGRAASLDRSFSRTGSSLQGSRVRDYSAMPSVSLLDDRSDFSAPQSLSLATRSNFVPTPPKPTSGFVDLAQETVGGRQVSTFTGSRPGVIDSLLDRLPNMPSLPPPKATDFSSTQRVTQIKNYPDNTSEHTVFEQVRQHRPPPNYQANVVSAHTSFFGTPTPPMVQVDGRWMTQELYDELVAQDQAMQRQRQRAELMSQNEQAAQLLYYQQHQLDADEEEARRLQQLQQDEAIRLEEMADQEQLRQEDADRQLAADLQAQHDLREAQRRELAFLRNRSQQQREQFEVDREPITAQSEREENFMAARLRRDSASTRRPTVDGSSFLFDRVSSTEPTLNQLNSLEHSEAGSIADDIDLPLQGDTVDSSLPFDTHSDDNGAMNLDDNTEPIVYAFVKDDVEQPATVTTTATTAAVAVEADQAGSSGGRSRGRGRARKAGVAEDLSRRFRHDSDSEDSDGNVAPAARASDRKSTNKLAFNRDVFKRASAYSDGEEDLEQNEESDEVPDGFMKIPKYNYIHPRTISACALLELIQSVTDEDLEAYRKVVRDNIVGQLVLLSRGDVPNIDRPAMKEDERTQFQHLLEDPSTYQLGEELPSAIIQPPIYRKLQYLQDVCDDGLNKISEEARDCGAFIYALQGQAARRNVKGVGRSKDIKMEDYVPPDISGLHLPRFFMLVPASSNAVETFIGEDVTAKYHAMIADDPHKIRELLLAYHSVGKKVDKADISYLFPKEENRPVKVLLMKNLAKLIWQQYPNLRDFNKHFWAHIQRKHPDLVFVCYSFDMSLINPSQEVVYFGQTNKRGYLGVAFGTESKVCLPESTVRLFGVPEPFGQHPGKLPVHDYQESSRTVNYSVRAESADEVIDIERKHLFPAEYAKCPLFNLHPKFYNPQRLVELSEGRIKVGICVLNSGEMLTHFDGAFKGQIALGPLETSNTRFAAAYNRTLALQLSQPRRLGPVCICYGNEENAIIAADTQPRLDAAFRSLTRDPAFQLTDESENACFPCRLYPVGDTWEYRQGVLQNHLKAGRDKESDLPRLACPSPMGNIPKELRDDLKSCHADRIARGLSVDVLATAAAGGDRKPRKPRTKKAPTEKQPSDTVPSVSGPKRKKARQSGPLSFKPRSKRAKMDVDAKEETPEDREDETPEETPKNREEENEDAESEEHEESEQSDSESDGEKKPTTKRVKKSPIIYSEDEEDDDKPESPDCQEVEEQVEEEKSSKRKGKNDPPPSVVEPATASAASKSSKKAPKTNKPSTKEKATVEPEKSQEPEKMSTRLSAAAAKTAAIPATPKRGRRELDSLLKSAVGFGKAKSDKRTAGEMQEEVNGAEKSGKHEPDLPVTYDVEAAARMATERGLRFWTNIPIAEVPIKPAVVSSVPIPEKMDSFVQACDRAETLGYDVAAAEKLAKERGLISWAYLPHSDIPTKESAVCPPASKPLPDEKYGEGERNWGDEGSLIAAVAGTSTSAGKVSAIKRTPAANAKKTPSVAMDKLRSNTKAASEAAKEADKAKKKGGGKQFPSKAFVEDGDEKANGEGDDSTWFDEM